MPLILFSAQPEGFLNQHLREHHARLLGIDPSALTNNYVSVELRSALDAFEVFANWRALRQISFDLKT